jgi:aryl-alcohol dehydrogenase-like predicted oxidoreductase
LQLAFNMLQGTAVDEVRDYCQERRVSIAAYWVLMKGLLAGHLQRDHRFDPSDRRLTYDIYQGEKWQRNQDFLDRVRLLADRIGWSVVRTVVRWTIQQPGVTVALCGAKRPEQIRESAEALSAPLPEDAFQELNRLIGEH